jgi:hypothetical protein
MGWGHYVDPQEAKAAAEASEKMEAARAEADGRTEVLATAILEGFAMVAAAIRDAAGIVHAEVYDGPLDDVMAADPLASWRTGPLAGDSEQDPQAAEPQPAPEPDPDLDHLLNTDQGQ